MAYANWPEYIRPIWERRTLLVPLLLVWALLILSPTTGCYELRRFKEMDIEVRAMQEKLKVLEQNQARMDEQLENLSKTSRTGIAGHEATFTDIRKEIQELRGQLDDLKYELGEATGIGDGEMSLKGRVETLDKKLNAALHAMGFSPDQFVDKPKDKDTPPDNDTTDKDKPPPPPPLPEGPKKDYRAAKELFENGRYDEARAAFMEFVNNHPTISLVDDAQLMVGECYFKEKQYEEAILEYNKVIKDYPKGDMQPKAMLKIGYSFANLNKNKEASLFLKEVIRRFPDSNEASLAKIKLEKLK